MTTLTLNTEAPPEPAAASLVLSDREQSVLKGMNNMAHDRSHELEEAFEIGRTLRAEFEEKGNSYAHAQQLLENVLGVMEQGKERAPHNSARLHQPL